MHVMKTFKMYCLSNYQIYCLSNYQIYNTVSFTIVTMLHILSPELICLAIQSLYLLVRQTHFFQTLHPLPLATTGLFSISISSF